MEKVVKSDEEWREELTPKQYEVTRKAATERPFSGHYVHTDEDGVYRCIACGNELFSSDAKFDSGSGWPSFYEPADTDAVQLRTDTSHGMRRVEVLCARCEAHLGHVFEDGPEPTGQRYCMNSHALDLERSE